VLEPSFDPPYVAVIFTSVRTTEDEAGYAAMSAAMEQLAAAHPGYLGVESVRDPETRYGIAVSYWRTDADARAWKAVAEHGAAQRVGRERWYEGYRARIATVEREYAMDAAEAAEAIGRDRRRRSRLTDRG
jgi:heme-degrading monooxygenase HmoA